MDLAVVLNAPRSGSTYLQNLLSLHPRVVTPQETHLFHNYLAPLLTEWDRQAAQVAAVADQLAAGATPQRRLIGLPTLLDEDDFLDWARSAVTLVTERTAATKPAADLVVEKTPSNSLVARRIAQLRPDTRFVNLVRDPVKVVASQLGAGTWAGPWADVDAHKAAHRWVAHVEAATRLAADGAPVHLIRYEDLVASPAEVLHELLGFLRRPLEPAECSSLVERVAAGELHYALRPSLSQRITPDMWREPAGFARTGGERRRTLSAVERHVVAGIAGPLAAELGYTIPSHPGWTVRARAHGVALGHRLARPLGRLGP